MATAADRLPPHNRGCLDRDLQRAIRQELNGKSDADLREFLGNVTEPRSHREEKACIPNRLTFDEDPSLGERSSYDVSADGRFFMVEDVVAESVASRKPAIRITENWYEEFREREQN